MDPIKNKRVGLFGLKRAAEDHALVVAETPGWFNVKVARAKAPENNMYGVWASYDPELDTRNNERKEA